MKLAVLLLTVLSTIALAQPGAAPKGAGKGKGKGPQAPNVISPEVRADRTVAFRIYAPNAQTVRLNASDIANLGNGQMTKGTNGVWEYVTPAIDPGTYRYSFNVDGAALLDPRNVSSSESNNNSWSMVNIPGADFMDTRDVPRGAIAEVTYFSKELNTFRRLHVYTPPGYEISRDKYPIFYLLHGAGDSDDSWSTVGRAGFIMDNLIAAKKAKPMVVVMPAGHTPAPRVTAPAALPAAPSGGANSGFNDAFVQEFQKDIMPMVEARYRVQPDRAHRAIAGLSMGGAHTLNIAIPNLEKFAYIGVYSSGIFGQMDGYETANLAMLDNANAKKGLKLFWFSTGSDDFLLNQTKQTVAMFQKHGFQPVYKESTGGHTWINWRNYLNEFAPQLFQWR